MATLERAIALSAQAHAGQVDKAGQPYILHPLRVMLSVTGLHDRIAAVLHDVVEDTAITLKNLRDEGFSEEVIEAVATLTKAPGETRLAAAQRAVVNPIARRVKLADVTDNMDLSRITEPTEKDYARLQEYGIVRALLLDSKTCDIATPGVETPG
jgi:GTP diphosphokinase / guanosine-3',5'-bis(diphosphate) 3'-diphosphatase